MPLVLDDNVIRSLGHREVSPGPLIAYRDEGGSVHVADGAMAELAHQLLEGRLPWQNWLVARDALRQFLDVAEPVLLGGRQGLYRAGIRRVTDDVPPAEIASAVEDTSTWWHAFIQAEHLGGITAPVRVGNSVLGLSPEATAREVAAFKNDWVETFGSRRIDDQLVIAVQETMPGRGDPIEHLDAIVGHIARDLDNNARAQQGPPVSLRLDAMIRVHVLLRLASMRRRDPYDAEKHVNDSFDHELLRYLAYPAAICTRDRGIARRMKRAKCWQAPWVVEPEQLASAAVRLRIRTLDWPAPPVAS